MASITQFEEYAAWEADHYAWEEYGAWLADHCEHGVPPGEHCQDCHETDWYWMYE